LIESDKEPNKISSERRGERDNNINKLPFHIFLEILFLLIVADILLTLAVPVLDDPDNIIGLRWGEIFNGIQGYGVKFDPYGKALYAMLLTSCVLGLYSTSEFISSVKKEEKITLTPNLKRMLPILSLFIFLYIVYISIESNTVFILFSIVLILYHVFVLYKYAVKGIVLDIVEDYKKKDIYVFLLIPFMILLISFCFLFPMQVTHCRDCSIDEMLSLLQKEDFNLFFLKRLLMSLIVFTSTFYMISESLGKESSKQANYEVISIIRYMGSKVREYLVNEVIDSIKNYHLNWGIFLYSIFLYGVICLFFVEIKPHSGVLVLLIVAIIISLGFYISGYTVSRIWDKNRGILEILGIRLGEERPDSPEVNKEEDKKLLREKLRKYISDLLLNFLIAISSYVFLSALLKTHLSGSLPLSGDHLKLLFSDLNLILFVPLYLFFVRAGSAITENLYGNLYERNERSKGISHDERRKNSFVKVFVTLTKIVILILIIFHIFTKFEASGAIENFVTTSPFSYMIELAIAIPITMQILVLILDPFFEKETIQIGSNIGRIKDVGFFFTKMETMTGENVYIPNAELIARTIRRLNARIPESETNELDQEKGIMVHFSCTLNYNYSPQYIEHKFTELFKNKNKKDLKSIFENIKCEITEKQLNFIFSEDSHPFIFIEEFKDYGVVYRFNFRVRNALYAPILRGYFMKKFKEEMDRTRDDIYTPVKFEITDMMSIIKIKEKRTETKKKDNHD